MTYLKARIKPSEIRVTTTADFTTCPVLLITTANSGEQKAADKKPVSLLPTTALTSNANRTATLTHMFVHTSECE